MLFGSRSTSRQFTELCPNGRFLEQANAQEEVQMTSELKKRLESVRVIGSRLDDITAKATKTVHDVEKVLVEEMNIRVPAQTRWYGEDRSRRRDPRNEDDFIEEEVSECLAYGRANGEYCVHVKTGVFGKDDEGYFNRELGSEKTPWLKCDRETRLRTFAWFPELLEAVITEAQRMAEIAELTNAKVEEFIGEQEADAAFRKFIEHDEPLEESVAPVTTGEDGKRPRSVGSESSVSLT